MNIFLIEDDSNISFAIKRFFTNLGNNVECCSTLAGAYEIHPERQDFIILDINLPDGEGFEYLSYIRSEGIKTPLLLLTVRDQEKDIIRGLEMGADDYLTKPFSLSVLKARMETILRRASLDKNESIIQCGHLMLDKQMKMAFMDQQPLELSQKEFELMLLFMENQGMTLPRERILDLLWGFERGEVYDNTLSVTVKRLREKIIPYQNYIRTIRGIGYRLMEEKDET